MNAAPYARDPERARKIRALILSRLASAGQVNLAEALGVDEATISKTKSKQGSAKYPDLDLFCEALGFLRLKVVPIERQCYTPEYMQALRTLARVHINDPSDPTEDDPE